MSLKDAIDKLATLGGKSSGNLIRFEDWNDLILSLETYGAALTTQQADIGNLRTEVDGLSTRLEDVVERADALKEGLDTLELQVKPLLSRYLVTLSCDRALYAVGDLCPLTAKVTDLGGRPISAPYPWVDFVASWGRLRAKAGFTSRAGAGERALSVQVNAQGIAQVWLRADHTEGVSEADEAQIGSVLQTQAAGATMTVSEAILSAASPSDQRAKAAYAIVTKEYERKDSSAMRIYGDTYHARTPDWQVAPVGASTWTRWQDYYATVVALAKPDADPTTADGTRGGASIQVQFRDWLWSWSHDYLDDDSPVAGLATEYGPIFQGADVFGHFQRKFEKAYEEGGILGRKKYVSKLQKALDLVNPGPDPEKGQLREQIKSAVAAQGTAEIHGGGKTAEKPSITQAYVGQGSSTEGVKTQMNQVTQKVEETKGIQAAVSVLEGRMQATERVGLDIHSNLTLINDNVRAINPLDEASLKANVQQISANIAALKSRLG
jgi:hypothetical protein